MSIERDGVTGETGVMLMTYGSPDSLEREDVGAYLARVRGGREPDPDLVEEFTRRYQVIGGSPLIEITRRQAAALETELGWPVAAGMRFSEPSIATSLAGLTSRGARSVVGIVLSPQYSPLLMHGYATALDAAAATITDPAQVRVAGAWHREPAFIEALATSICAALGQVGSAEGGRTAVLMTAHSLPRRVADQEPVYLDQLRETAEAVAMIAGLSPDDWRFCWQSAGHEPGEWMQPDFADLMPVLAAEGATDVVVAPVQFLADHLETLYDVDIGAREQAEAAGLRFRRARSLGVDPGLISALGSVARRVALEEADESS